MQVPCAPFCREAMARPWLAETASLANATYLRLMASLATRKLLEVAITNDFYEAMARMWLVD